MTIDSTFEFEKRRNVPVRYNRELMQTTIKAMKRVAEIKARRERAFWKNRMSGNKARAITQQTTDIARHIELVQPRTKDQLSVEARDVIRQKIRVAAAKRPGVQKTKALKRSALVPTDQGASMGMETE